MGDASAPAARVTYAERFALTFVTVK